MKPLELRKILAVTNRRPLQMRSTTPLDPIDSRQDTRIPVELSGNLRLGTRVFRVIVKELSAGSATIKVSKHFPYGVVLTLQIDGVGEFEAEQTWWTKDHKVGLKFSGLHPEICEPVRKLSVVQRDA